MAQRLKGCQFDMMVVGLAGFLTAQVFAYQQPLGTPVHGLQASITTNREVYRVGESIDVTVVLTTVSDTSMMIDPWPGNWFVRVYDENVIVVKPFSRAIDVIRSFADPLLLRPGERWSTEIRGLRLTTGLPGSTPNWEYQPLNPGTYWLGAEYSALPDSHNPKMWSGRLQSKLVKITVVENNAGQAPPGIGAAEAVELARKFWMEHDNVGSSDFIGAPTLEDRGSVWRVGVATKTHAIPPLEVEVDKQTGEVYDVLRE